MKIKDKETYEYMKRLIKEYESNDQVATEDLPYLESYVISKYEQYNKHYGDHRICTCGRKYREHFWCGYRHTLDGCTKFVEYVKPITYDEYNNALSVIEKYKKQKSSSHKFIVIANTTTDNVWYKIGEHYKVKQASQHHLLHVGGFHSQDARYFYVVTGNDDLNGFVILKKDCIEVDEYGITK